ncbi:MAG: hypothetical protein U0840_24965 [Gemmataceae bacterium]
MAVWPAIQKIQERQTHLLVFDNTGVMMNPLERLMWARKGRTPEIDADVGTAGRFWCSG